MCVQVAMGISIVFIILSTVMLVLHSVQCIFDDDEQCKSHNKSTADTAASSTTVSTLSKLARIHLHDMFDVLDTICIGTATFTSVQFSATRTT